ncbi:MAG: hypothetical protein Q9181_006008 [Wetmoreana brouardii]
MSHIFSRQEAVEYQRSLWKDDRRYCPLFCLADTPGHYFYELHQHTQDQLAWLAVSSSASNFPQIMTEIKSKLENGPIPDPFINCTISHVYSFFKDHLRQPEDSTAHHPFTHFTFLAVDSECSRPPLPQPQLAPGSPYDSDSGYTILLCTDAPDFYEDATDVRLKTLRLPIPAAIRYLDMVEQLLITPSEVQKLVFEDTKARFLHMLPIPILIPIEPIASNPRDQEYKIGTASEERANKAKGIRVGLASAGAPGGGIRIARMARLTLQTRILPSFSGA